MTGIGKLPPASRDRRVSELFSAAEVAFIDGIPTIAWAEDILEKLEEVLTLDAEFRPAIKLKEYLESELFEAREQAEKHSRLAESRFSFGDFAGCIEVLHSPGTGLINILLFGNKRAHELHQRTREKVRKQLETAPHDENARLLLQKIERIDMGWLSWWQK